MEHQTFLAAAQEMAVHHDESELGTQIFLGFEFDTREAAREADEKLRQRCREWVTTMLHQIPVQKVGSILHLNERAGGHPFASRCVTVSGQPSLMIRTRTKETADFIVKALNDNEQRPPRFTGKLPMRSLSL